MPTTGQSVGLQKITANLSRDQTSSSQLPEFGDEVLTACLAPSRKTSLYSLAESQPALRPKRFLGAIKMFNKLQRPNSKGNLHVSRLYENAMRYRYEYQWSVIPINHKAKQATIKWKPFQTSLPTHAQMKRWFGRISHSNIALILGQISSGIYARDFDTAESYEKWARANPKLAERCPTVQTHRGFHVYFHSDEPIATKSFEDGELRGDGVYLLLPPSHHPDGGIYEWIVPMIDPAGIPVLTASAFYDRPIELSHPHRNATDSPVACDRQSLRLSLDRGESSSLSLKERDMTNVKEIRPSDRRAIVEEVWGGMGGESALASNCPVYAFISRSSPAFLTALAKLLNDELRFPKPTVPQELDDDDAVANEGVLSTEDWPDKLTVDERAAIWKCIPKKERQREKKLFELARRLLAVGTLNKPDLNERGCAIFQRWWADARLVVRTKAPEESLRAFERACEVAKKPLHDALAVPAYELAMQQLGETPTWSTGLTAKCVQLGLACRSLQRSSPGEAFFLSARKAADLLEMSHHAQPARWLQLLVTAGVLEVVSAGTARSQKATRYRYIASDL